ncbi:MAG: linear amide C-N hydrolase [Eubacteriales bacterium]|nr:linear amide C-N hydrolase [Eubacteriales bacterium]
MCTHINISSNQNNSYWGRTLDINFNPFDLNSKITIVPKNFVLDTETDHWKTKYSFMGINLAGTTLFLDGLNEKGLAGGLLFLKACTWDTKENIKNDNLIPVNSGEIVTYILSNFETVEEIKENISKIAVTSEDIKALGDLGKNSPVTAHYTFTDKSGKSIVIEPTNNGRFRVFDNLVGVMTNDPTYDWHMTNLSNYIEVQDCNRKPNRLNEHIEISAASNGSGLLGLPGDYTSPSRFVRASYLRNLTVKTNDKETPANLFSILNTVCIPKGTERLVEGKDEWFFTSYMSVYDQNSGKLYVRLFNKLDTLEFSLDNVKEGELVNYTVD